MEGRACLGQRSNATASGARDKSHVEPEGSGAAQLPLHAVVRKLRQPDKRER